MKKIYRIAEVFAQKAVGSVDAGACVIDYGCCCVTHPGYGVGCYGNCIRINCRSCA